MYNKCTIVRGLVYFLFLFGLTESEFARQNLGGNWKVRDVLKSYSFEATVPGGIYTDMMKKNLIEDIFYGYNDNNTRWVSKRDWVYSKLFQVTEETFLQDHVDLIFEGIDTFATIYFNDKIIGKTDNMFVQYIFDIKRLIKKETNNLTVVFESPVRIAEEEFEKQVEKYVVGPACVAEVQKGECHVNHIRKMQASFSWDWGPAFPSMGIWKPVYIEAYAFTSIRYVTINVKSNDVNNVWDVEVTTYLSGHLKDPSDVKIVCSLMTNAKKIEREYQNGFHLSSEDNNDMTTIHVGKLTVPKSDVDLWWPNGFGNQTLYNLTVQSKSSDGLEVSEKRIRIGFRTIELMQETVEEVKGRRFYFKVNDVPIFMKGTNLIPINVLPELGSDETKVRFLLNSARDVHMNMIRVWGGGVYESDTLYDIADELGIIIWQDFMFAVSLYPVGDDFLKTVKQEVRHQVRRLQHHASIGLWVGNNENELALRTNWFNMKGNLTQYYKDYVTLYVDVIRTEFVKNDKWRQYLTSSPSNGIQSEMENYVAQNPGSTFYGDVHYYNYVKDSWDISHFPKARFSSEYGLQSLPSLKSWMSATNDSDDINLKSEFMLNRQHHANGNEEILFLIEERLKNPTTSEMLIYYSQILQAMAMKIETENYRRMKSILFDNGEGLTMGALYWQLNDVWVAPTWSSIDFKNRWKMLHYFAKDFFSPVIVTGIENNKITEIYAVSDLLTTIHNVNVIIKVYHWHLSKQLFEETLGIDLINGTSQIVKSFKTEEYLKEKNCNLNDCFIYLSIENGNNLIGPNNFLFPVPLKNANIPTPNLKVINVTKVDNNFEVTIETDKISLFVWLESGDVEGKFSENGFLLIEKSKTVHFYPQAKVNLNEFKSNLKILNLQDQKFFNKTRPSIDVI